MVDHSPAPQGSASDCTPDAAARGNAEAQFGLGLFYAAGTAPRYAQAMEWYQRAADQGHHLAQFNLGQMYRCGHGVPPSDAMALYWFRRAAEGGDAGAQFVLGERFSRAGARVADMDADDSRVECYKWYTLAAGQQYRDASLRSDTASMRMTREQVTEGRRRVATFQESCSGNGSC